MIEDCFDFLIFILGAIHASLGIFAFIGSFAAIDCGASLWNWGIVNGIMSITGGFIFILTIPFVKDEKIVWRIYFHCLPAFVINNISAGFFLSPNRGTCEDSSYLGLFIPLIITSALLGLIYVLKGTQMILESFTKPIPEENPSPPELMP